jgi:hypothetical protein
MAKFDKEIGLKLLGTHPRLRTFGFQNLEVELATLGLTVTHGGNHAALR